MGTGFGFGAREHVPERRAEVEVEARAQHGGQRAVVERGRGAQAELRPAGRLVGGRVRVRVRVTLRLRRGRLVVADDAPEGEADEQDGGQHEGRGEDDGEEGGEERGDAREALRGEVRVRVRVRVRARVRVRIRG